MSTSLENIVSLAKRRGYIYPSSEIYGGFAAIYDYGPYGVELEKNIKESWWKWMVQMRQDIVGLDSSIFMNPKIWHASGHVAGFSDPLVECKNCNTRSRVDKMLADIDVFADEKMSVEEISAIFSHNMHKLKCPNCGATDFSDIKKFNLLVKSNLGNYTENWAGDPSYLRGETCQGIYVNFKNVTNTMRVKIPFGIAQIGKAFRNEITARKFTFRTREFEQMEMQYFLHPDDELEAYQELKQNRWNHYLAMGFNPSNLRWHEHENLVFYAKAAFDIEYKYPWGYDELEGIHARGDYDLSQHQQHSGVDLQYTDPITQQRYIPHIIESSAGVGRTLLALLIDSYQEEGEGKDKRIFLKLRPQLAPMKAAVFPLLRNKPELVEIAQKVFSHLQPQHMCEYDDSGNIGKRYRRQDEIGTPYCITIDYQTLKDDSLTIRHRDTTAQERVSISKISAYIAKHLDIKH